jgi:hypothetical protein
MLRPPPTESLDSPRRHSALQSGGDFQVHAAGRPDGRGLLQRPAPCLFFQQLTKGAAGVCLKTNAKGAMVAEQAANFLERLGLLPRNEDLRII